MRVGLVKPTKGESSLWLSIPGQSTIIVEEMCNRITIYPGQPPPLIGQPVSYETDLPWKTELKHNIIDSLVKTLLWTLNCLLVRQEVLQLKASLAKLEVENKTYFNHCQHNSKECTLQSVAPILDKFASGVAKENLALLWKGRWEFNLSQNFLFHPPLS